MRHRGLHEWGLPWLTEPERRRVAEANVLMVNFLALCLAVSEQEGFHFHEHPADLGKAPLPSIWDSRLVADLETSVAATRGEFDQCMFGGPCRKPTCISGTLDGLAQLNSVRYQCDGKHTHAISFGKEAALPR